MSNMGEFEELARQLDPTFEEMPEYLPELIRRTWNDVADVPSAKSARYILGQLLSAADAASEMKVQQLAMAAMLLALQWMPHDPGMVVTQDEDGQPVTIGEFEPESVEWSEVGEAVGRLADALEEGDPR